MVVHVFLNSFELYRSIITDSEPTYWSGGKGKGKLGWGGVGGAGRGGVGRGGAGLGEAGRGGARQFVVGRVG